MPGILRAAYDAGIITRNRQAWERELDRLLPDLDFFPGLDSATEELFNSFASADDAAMVLSALSAREACPMGEDHDGGPIACPRCGTSGASLGEI